MTMAASKFRSCWICVDCLPQNWTSINLVPHIKQQGIEDFLLLIFLPALPCFTQKCFFQMRSHWGPFNPKKLMSVSQPLPKLASLHNMENVQHKGGAWKAQCVLRFCKASSVIWLQFGVSLLWGKSQCKEMSASFFSCYNVAQEQRTHWFDWFNCHSRLWVFMI